MIKLPTTLWIFCIFTPSIISLCHGHGRLVDPPSRASAWRFGFNTPIDYNDNEGFCGGYTYQHQIQGGRCGLCGDAWDESPRPHEVGGKYATGTIVQNYTQGQIIPVRVDLTSNHMGHFEFRICPNNNPDVEATQTCLNKYPLYQADGSGFKYRVPQYNGFHNIYLRLPKTLTCTQCVLQWRYVAGNNWGYCTNGTGAVGCGPQEEFRACADVSVKSLWGNTGFTKQTTETQTDDRETETVTSSYSWYSTPNTDLTPPPISQSQNTLTTRRTPTTRRRTTPTTRRTTPTTRRTTPTFSRQNSTPSPTTPAEGGCRAVGVWASVPGMDLWCERNCNHVPSYCPASHCICT